MKNARKLTREWLENTSKTIFERSIEEAKLSPRQMEIAKLKFTQYLYNYQIAMKMCLSPETVKKELAKIYDKVTKLYLF